MSHGHGIDRTTSLNFSGLNMNTVPPSAQPVDSIAVLHFSLERATVLVKRPIALWVGVIASGVLAVGSLPVMAQVLPEIANLTDCAQAVPVAAQADKQLPVKRVAEYEARVLELCRSQQGSAHSNTQWAMSSLAHSLRTLGQHEAALKLYEELLAARRTQLGSDDPKTLDAMADVGYTLGKMGQHKRAVEVYEPLLKLRRAKLGDGHSTTLWTIDLLADRYRDLGQHEPALKLYEELLAARRTQLGSDAPKTLGAMADVGYTLVTMGQHKRAVAVQEPLLKLRQAKLGQEHADTLESMNILAIIYDALGRHEEALTLHEQTLKLMRANLGNAHPSTLNSMNNLAESYRHLGHNDKALALNEQTFKLRREKFGNDHPNTLASMNNLAASYSGLGQWDKALALNEQTLKLSRAKLGEDHPNTLVSMNNLAASYRDLGQLDKALVLNEQTLKLHQSKLGEDHPDTLASMNNLAASYRDLGQLDKALALNEQTLKLHQSKLGEDHPDTLASMNNLAASYRDLGQLDKALVLNEQTLKLRRAKLGEDHPNTLMSMHNLATSYRELGQLDKALVLNEQTLKLRRAKLGEDHPNTLSSMENLAASYYALGQLDKALVLNEQTLKLRRAKLGEDHPDTLMSLHNLAANYSALNQQDKAVVLKEQTLKLRRAKLGENHPDTLMSMNNLANSYITLHQTDQAFALIRSIVHGAEHLRSQPGLTTEQRQSVFAQYSDGYQTYARWYAKESRLPEAFNLGDLSKARTLTDSIRAQAALRTLPAPEQRQLQASEAQAQQFAHRLEAQRDPAAMLNAQRDIETHNATHARLLERLKATYPKYARLTELTPATAADAARLLRPGEHFISYLVHDNGQAQVFVLDADGEPLWLDLGQLPNHRASVAAYRELISPADNSRLEGRLMTLHKGGHQWVPAGQMPPAGSQLAAERREQARALLDAYWHSKLIAPVLRLAGESTRWIISPDKDLALLPFDLLDEQAGQPLSQTRTLTVVQSFAVYALLRQRDAEYAKLKRPRDLLAMGNPVYNSGWPNQPGTRERNSTFEAAGTTPVPTIPTAQSAPLSIAAEQFQLHGTVWANLAGTEREIQAVAWRFSEGAAKGSPAVVDTFLGERASESQLQQLNQSGQLQDYRYLLFSAHGYLAQNPALSALVLSQRSNPEGVDGYITASEWPLYDVRSDLTVLSACDTGVGRTQAGESVMGLPYALFVAGNKNTLLTLWPVNDDATAEFIARFFGKVRSGTPQPEALALTKREFARHSQWSHPRFWAGFVLYGI